jgi:sigma-B regulation protein RsbU (phosphoserine phosphatase)
MSIPIRGALPFRNDLLEEFEGVAAHIQRQLLEIPLPTVAGFEFGAKAAPARVVGGDYVDVISGRIELPIFAIGDVSGKSLPAALTALSLRFLIRGLTHAFGDDLRAIVRNANRMVCEEIDEDSFVTFALATMTEDRRVLRLVNAGHDPPVIMRAATGEIDTPAESGLVLGVDPRIFYEEQRIAVEPGDIVVFYTDGFTEAANADGEQFTLAHLKDELAINNALPMQELAETLFRRVELHARGPLRDDASILAIRIAE